MRKLNSKTLIPNASIMLQNCCDPKNRENTNIIPVIQSTAKRSKKYERSFFMISQLTR